MGKAFALGFITAMAATVPAVAADKDATEIALQRCLDDPVNASTAGQSDCEATASRSYDQRMNRAYAALMTKLPAGAKHDLQMAQRAWVAFRSAEDVARSALYATRQGTLYVPMEAASETDIVRDRARELEGHLRVIKIEH